MGGFLQDVKELSNPSLEEVDIKYESINKDVSFSVIEWTPMEI